MRRINAVIEVTQSQVEVGHGPDQRSEFICALVRRQRKKETWRRNASLPLLVSFLEEKMVCCAEARSYFFLRVRT